MEKIKDIIKKIPLALKNMGVDDKVAPLVENYLLNRIIECSVELRALSDKEFEKFLKEL